MVQVKVEQEEKAEAESKEPDPQVTKTPSGANGSPENQEEKVVPLENMKKAELLEKVKEVQAVADKNYELYLRSQAEIENLKKRFQKEKAELIKFSNESLIKQLVAVIDNLEKAVSAANAENPIIALKEGVELTLKGLIDTLEKSGLAAVEAQGKKFDPNFHEAIFEQEDNSVKPGTVLQVFQKGYLLNDRLMRPAMVVVSKNSG